MKFTVIIPFYNMERYLSECIDSVLRQSYQEIEILLINDGSTDGSEAICRKYEKQYSNVKLINKPSGGPSDARNTGIKHSTGDYIAFLDSDDYWDEDFLSDIAELIHHNKDIDYVFFRYKYYYQKSNVQKEQKYEFEHKYINNRSGLECLKYMLNIRKNYQWMPWQGVVRKNFILEHNLFFEQNRTYEDVLWTPLVFLKAGRVQYYDRAVYVYRLEREGQITSQISKKNLEDNIYVVAKWIERLEQMDVDKKIKELLLMNITVRYYYVVWYLDFLGNENEKAEIIRYLKQHRDKEKYNRSLICLFTSLLVTIAGFRTTSRLFKFAILLNRRLKQNQGA